MPTFSLVLDELKGSVEKANNISKNEIGRKPCMS